MVMRIACLSVLVSTLAFLLAGCPMPPSGPQDEPNTNANGGDGSNPPTATSDSGADALEKLAYSVIAVRVEDRRRIAGNAKPRRRAQVLDLFNGPCLNGGSRSTDPDGVMTFEGCEVFPGLELNGGVRIVPDPNGGQGGRIDFFDLQGRTDGNEFRVDGSIEEIEEPDGGLTFRLDLRSSTDDGEYNDEFNVNGEINVNEDDEVFGNLRIDTGDEFDFQRPSRCQFEGQNLFGIVQDPSSFERLCPEEEFAPISAIDPELPEDPAGVALASQILAEIDADERATDVVGPSFDIPNTLFGLVFENARVYAQMDAVDLNVVGISVENPAGQYLYTLENRYRGLTMTLGTGDVLRLDVSEGGAIDAEMVLNSTAPPSTIAVRVNPDGSGLVNETRTRIFDTPNPDYGLARSTPPAKQRLRSAGIRLNRSDCVEVIGSLRAVAGGACDLKDLLTGELLERAPETLCVLARRAATLGGPDDPRLTAAFNLSLTAWCTVIKKIGLGARFASKLTPAEVACKLLSITSDFVQGRTGETPEQLVCDIVTRGDWFPDRIEIIGFTNEDGSTEETAGATEDARIIPFGDDPGHPTFEWSPLLVPRADFVILTAESIGGEQELLFWLARGMQSIPRIVPYGHYNKGIRGVSNVPYPAPPLEAQPEDWFYRLRIRLDGGAQIETRFRIVDSRQAILEGNVGEPLERRPGLFGEIVVREPVAGATVKVLEGNRVVGEGTTDDDGDYRIERLEPGPVTIRVERDGYARVQREVELRTTGVTSVNISVASENGVCSSDLGLIRPIRGPMRRDRAIDVLLSDEGAGIGPEGLMICVGGTRNRLFVNWNNAWVADHMRAVDGEHLGDYSDLELRVTSVRLRHMETREIIAQSFNFSELLPPAELKLPDNEPLLIPGEEYWIELDIFAGSIIVITTEPWLLFQAR